ncbi:MAG TPA: GNAT family N-acetyltransferase [Geodermatophilus sp.]|nr:GNAT family N-acetyltransferase [Geodermatophilus sp.]
MLRPITAQDTSSVVDLVVAAGMSSREDAQFLHGALLPDGDGTTCLVEDPEDQGLASVVPYRPEEAADRVYDLTMIAVRPDLQGGGRGARLVRHAEEDLRRRGQGLLVVRTSGTPRYDRTRAFHRSPGHAEHTPVADYRTDGDDLVLCTTRP